MKRSRWSFAGSMPGEYGERRLCAWLVLCVVVMTLSLAYKIAFLYPVCYHECTAVNWRETLSPQTSQFTLGMTQAGQDVTQVLASQVTGGVRTTHPSVPLSVRERRDWLRGYAAGLLQALSETKAPGAPRYPQERSNTEEGAAS